MPLVRAIETLPDGFRVIHSSGRITEITSADIPPAMLRGPPADFEAAINMRLAQAGYNAAVKVIQLVPLIARVIIGNAGLDLSTQFISTPTPPPPPQ